MAEVQTCLFLGTVPNKMLLAKEAIDLWSCKTISTNPPCPHLSHEGSLNWWHFMVFIGMVIDKVTECKMQWVRLSVPEFYPAATNLTRMWQIAKINQTRCHSDYFCDIPCIVIAQMWYVTPSNRPPAAFTLPTKMSINLITRNQCWPKATILY